MKIRMFTRLAGKAEPTPVIIDTDIGNSTDDLANADGSKMFPRTDTDLSDNPDGHIRYQLPGDDRWLEEQMVYLRYYTLMH